MGIRIMIEGGKDCPMTEAGSWRECAETLLALSSELERRFSAPQILILETAAPAEDAVRLERKTAALTGREKEVLHLVAQGMSNKEIAAFLHISERTVKNHLSSIYRKLEVSDRTQAAIFALGNI